MWLDVEDNRGWSVDPKDPHPQVKSITPEQIPLARNYEEEQGASGTQGPPISL